jgi:hypothetical protein
VVGALAALVGPTLVRRARAVYAPIGRMKSEQTEFESWARAKQWHEPATPTLSAEQLDAFLALRAELRRLDESGDTVRRRARSADGGRPGLADVPRIMEGVGGLVTDRLAAFRRSGLTPDEYDYVERLVYGTWLAGLVSAGADPAARERAAAEIDRAAAGEAPAVRARLKALAGELRARVPPAPPGVPDEVHRLLVTRVAAIAAQPRERVWARVPRARERRREGDSSPSGSPPP